MSQRARHRLALLGAAFLFSTGGSVIKLTSWSGVEVAAGRSIVAAVVLLLLMPGWRRFWDPRALLVGTAYAATLSLFVVANKLTTAANAIFLQSTAPLYVLVLAPWLLAERNRRSDVAITSLMLGGLALFFVDTRDAAATATDPRLGDLVATAAGVTWAGTLVGLRWIARADPAGGRSGPALAGSAVVAGNLLAFAVCLPFIESPPTFDAENVGAVAYLGVFQVGLAYVWMNRGIAGVPALEASLLLLLEPVLAIGLAAWVHRELPGPWALAGCAVILGVSVARTLLATRQQPASSG